jgi:hypothetical protein
MPIVCIDAPGGSYWKDWLAWVERRLLGGRLIGADDLRLVRVTDDVEEAVREVTGFYANYHSSRFVGDRLVLRLRHLPDPGTLERLNDEFVDVLAGGRIEVASSALPREAGEFEELPRLVLEFERRATGRLRILIDRLNELAPAPEPPLEAGPPEVIAGRLTPEQERAEEEE